MPQPAQPQRALRQRRSRRKIHLRRDRSFLGEDSWIEIAHKLLTIGTLFFGVWAYFNSVQPVFEKERELQAERERVGKLAKEVGQLKMERSTLQQSLEKYQAVAATYRHGLVLYYLSGIKRDVQREALIYQRLAPATLDLRDQSLAYTDRMLKVLGPVQPASPESYQKAALEFFRRFADENIPPKTTDVRRLDDLLDAYDRQLQGTAGASP